VVHCQRDASRILSSSLTRFGLFGFHLGSGALPIFV
jgi:hypothetical protein